MKYPEAIYILHYFPRLMNELEQKANRQHLFSLKLGNLEDYENPDMYQTRKKFFEKRNRISSDSAVLKLLENGYEEFVIKTAKRIKKESPNQFTINRCSICNTIARTPYARQCRNCGNNWHDVIGAEFQFEMTLRITGRPYLWIIGELLKGHFQVGYSVDLTNFQLNIIAEIKQIEFYLKSIDGVKKDYPSLGIEVNEEEEELIKKYLKKSAKTIIILKEKEQASD